MDTKTRARPMQIGELAGRTGVNIETIRYYERAGLLPAPPRSEGRRRLYDMEHVRRLRFVRRGRELGFSLDDIRALLAIVDEGDADCTAAKDIALRHLADVHGKIASLRRLERALNSLTDACRPQDQVACPIIESLSANQPVHRRPA